MRSGTFTRQGYPTGQTVKLSSFVRPIALAIAVGGATLAPIGEAHAGLFDFLFGGSRPAPQYYAPSYGAPLDVRVNPQKRKREGAQRVRPGKERTTKVSNTSIDPRKHPNWHLEDPTLRRGDIVVLPTGAMVYQGGARPQTREDFSKLSDSRLVSKRERDRIKDMVGPPTVTAEKDEALRNKEASGPSYPVQ